MRIGWFTPAQGGGLAEVPHTLRALGHEVVVVALDRDGEPPAPALSWRDRDRLGPVDLRCYVAADDFAIAAALFDLVRRDPGLVLLPGPTLDRYFDGLWRASGRPRRRADVAALATAAQGLVVPSEDAAIALAQCFAGAILTAPPPGSFPDTLRYAARLLEFVDEAARAQPLLRAARDIAMRLRETGVEQGDAVIDRVATAAASLFG